MDGEVLKGKSKLICLSELLYHLIGVTLAQSRVDTKPKKMKIKLRDWRARCRYLISCPMGLFTSKALGLLGFQVNSSSYIFEKLPSKLFLAKNSITGPFSVVQINQEKVAEASAGVYF